MGKTPAEIRRFHSVCKRPGKNGGYPNFASDVSCVPGCRGDSVARHSSFKTWSRLGVGDRLRGSHLDQDQVSLSSQPPVFPGLQFSELGRPPAYDGKTALTIGPREKQVLVLPAVELDAGKK